MFGDGGTAPAQSDPTMVAAVTPSPASSTPPVTLPAPRASATVGPRGGYAQDSPERTIRTGVLGECVKTGMWEPSDVMIGCGAGQTVAKVDEQAALPAAVRAEPQVEPVEVQPLATPALKEEKTLEVEPVAAPQPEPAPEPPVAIPEPPKPQMTTLSADALFAVGSHQLKPAAKASLDDFAAQLKSMEFESIRIVGHTDPTGKAAMNDRLSRQRAESVKRYLVGRGIPADRIQTEGVGSSMPMVVETDCATLPRAQKAACYQPDRRVEIEVQGVTSRVAAQ
jgi:outer membrane protein OmpA-like peptidoglycan-associated protein